jgi:hypothetical protein
MPVRMWQNVCCEDFSSARHEACDCEVPIVRSEWGLSMHEEMARYQIYNGLRPVGPHRKLADELLAAVCTPCSRCSETGFLDSPDSDAWSLCPDCGGFGSQKDWAAARAIHERVGREFPDGVTTLSADPRADLLRMLGAAVVYSDGGTMGWENEVKAEEESATDSEELSANELILFAFFGHDVVPDGLNSAVGMAGIEGDGFDAEGYPTSLDAAVASILLGKVRDVLPQWAAIRGEEVAAGRKNVRRSANAEYAPKHLFTLNWAESGPGFSWPTAYFATTVPQHDAVVVTASADGPDAMGYTDFAIGYFRMGQDLLTGSKSVIVGHWRQQAINGQGRWAYLFDVGLVSEPEANQWADEVWQTASE